MAVNNSAFLTTVIALCACIGLMVVLVYQKNREIEALKSDLDTLTKEYNALAEKYNSGVRSPDATEGGLLRSAFNRVEGILQRIGGQEAAPEEAVTPENTTAVQGSSQTPAYTVNERGIVVANT